jgi:alpha-mannosidase
LPQLIRQRVSRMVREVEALCWRRSEELAVRGGPVNAEMLPLARGRRQGMKKVVSGETFGPPRGGWQQRWFRVDVPAPRPGEKGRRHLEWDCQGETTVYFRDEPWHGLDLAHRTCPLPDEGATLWLDCSTWQTGIWVGRPDREVISPHGLRFERCRLRLRDPLAWDVRWDLDALVQLLGLLYDREGIAGPAVFGHQPALEACSPLLRLLLRGLDEACDAFVSGALPALRDSLQALSRRLPAEVWQPVASLCGHAHLDLVWLWPEIATERKAIHSFATQLRLLERYPEMIFVQSQPALYRAVERLAPSMNAAIRRRIRQGRWEAMGAFEVEPDTNLPSGEALVRSLLSGQRKLRQLAGRPSPVCWIPDVFGYANCLPQILRLGGVKFFYTTKMTWSAVTRFPYSSFVWRGADGSEVVAHLCSTGYNGTAELANLDSALRRHRQADVHPEMLLPTGLGDGGGGVSESMCERARRLSSLAGAPRTSWSSTEAFFERLEAVRDRLPVYQGELYLEYHRGTLTTQSEFKRLYRAAEVALQAHEAVRVARGGAPLGDEAWQRVLFCQFHDAIPGSSIGLVYAELEAELAAIARRELDAAGAELAASRASRRKGQRALFNPLPQERAVVAEFATRPREATARARPLPVQKLGEGKRVRWLAAVSLGPLETVTLAHAAAARSLVEVAPVRRATRRLLDNGLVRAEFDANGQLRALAVEGQPLELEGPAGFALYHDLPANFDAWDIDHYSFRTRQAAAPSMRLEVVESGPVRARLRGHAAVGAASDLVVDYVLETGSRYLRVETRIDWRESHRLLKFHLPTAYRGRLARFGCPFGSIQRPQQPGVAADEAMWEVAGSRWAAVTRDDGTGLAVLAEAKYGFSCRDGDLGLSLLRSPKEPDPAADMRLHEIRFAIGRHEPRWREGVPNTASAAEALFAPVLEAAGPACPSPFELRDLDTLVPSAVLPAEGRGGFTLRLHETAGAAGTARLRLQRSARAVDLVDLLGNTLSAAPALGDGSFAISYGPYAIVSVAVR